MDKEQIKKIIDSPEEYDESKEDSYRSMMRDFFSKEMRWVMINVWVWFFIFLVPLVFSIIQFFRIDRVRDQIMYATIFICCCLGIGFIKAFGWVMMQKPRINRDIKRLELRIAELNETVKNK
jgi:glucan phosphoethanolaminetransferase (alkaline phosphatase superfamily)